MNECCCSLRWSVLLGVWLEDDVVRKTSCSWAEDCMTAHVLWQFVITQVVAEDCMTAHVLWEFVMDFACVIASLWVCLISQLFNAYINYCSQFSLQRSFILFKCWKIKHFIMFYLLFNYSQFFGRYTFFLFFFPFSPFFFSFFFVEELKKRHIVHVINWFAVLVKMQK